MSEPANCREASRLNWGGPFHIQALKLGALQRIADSVEKVAANYDELLRQKKAAEESAERWVENYRRMERSRAAMRGTITRLQRELQKARRDFAFSSLRS